MMKPLLRVLDKACLELVERLELTESEIVTSSRAERSGAASRSFVFTLPTKTMIDPKTWYITVLRTSERNAESQYPPPQAESFQKKL
jgi:hypothetical protein